MQNLFYVLDRIIYLQQPGASSSLSSVHSGSSCDPGIQRRNWPAIAPPQDSGVQTHTARIQLHSAHNSNFF